MVWRDKNVLRGLTLIGVALFFGLQAAGYPMGSFARAGAGLFPLMVSGAVGLIGLILLAKARFEQPEPMHFNAKNIAVILASLVGFVLIAQHLNTVLAIVYLVFLAGMAGAEPSMKRSARISVVLVGVAAAFHYLLGLSLPLL